MSRARSGSRIAGAPVSWGIIEIPDWGHQMPAERVLREAASLGMTALEAGPEGFLPEEASAVSDLLSKYGLKLVGGFVPAVLHVPDLRERELARVGERARFFAAAGAAVLVLAADTETKDYEEVAELDEGGWETLFDSLKRVEEVCDRHGLEVSLHPHYGTVIERDYQVKRFLEGSGMGLCFDTGHLVIGGSDPVEIVDIAGDRINHVHLKDVDHAVTERLGARELSFKEATQKGAFRPLGDGDVDVGAVVDRLESSGYSGWYVLEQDTVVEAEPNEGEGPVVEIRRSLEDLRGRLK